MFCFTTMRLIKLGVIPWVFLLGNVAFWVPNMPQYAHAGLLVPDIPLEETADIRRIAGAAGLELVMLVTPTTPEPRMRAIADVSQGFVYLVSVAGAPSRGVLGPLQGFVCLVSVAGAPSWGFLEPLQGFMYLVSVEGAPSWSSFPRTLMCTWSPWQARRHGVSSNPSCVSVAGAPTRGFVLNPCRSLWTWSLWQVRRPGLSPDPLQGFVRPGLRGRCADTGSPRPCFSEACACGTCFVCRAGSMCCC